MKVIDIINKVANGEEVPKKIRIAGWCYNFEWIEHQENYYDRNADIDLMSCLSMTSDELNREIEIIENNKKINKLTYQQIRTYNLDNQDYLEFVKDINKQITQLGRKINEIIDELNK